MTTPDDPIDFSSLDPTRDAAAFDGVARALATRAMAARAGAPREPDALTVVARWWRPVLLAAALAIAAALPTLARIGAPTPLPPATRVGALGIPAQVSDLLRSTQAPSVVELSSVLNGATP